MISSYRNTAVYGRLHTVVLRCHTVPLPYRITLRQTLGRYGTRIPYTAAVLRGAYGYGVHPYWFGIETEDVWPEGIAAVPVWCIPAGNELDRLCAFECELEWRLKKDDKDEERANPHQIGSTLSPRCHEARDTGPWIASEDEELSQGKLLHRASSLRVHYCSLGQKAGNNGDRDDSLDPAEHVPSSHPSHNHLRLG